MQAAPTYFVTTDQTGAQTQIDTAHTSSWTFTPTYSWALGGGIFAMKAGSSTIDDIRLTLYQGLDSTGTVLGQVIQTKTQFDAACVAPCSGGYPDHRFDFTTPVSLSAGVSYYLALTSTAPDVQSQAYFIKSGTYLFLNTQGTPVGQDPVPPAPPASVPEPGTAAAVILPLAYFALRAVRRTPAS